MPKSKPEAVAFKADERVFLKNINPLGDVYVPSLRLTLSAGEVFETDGKTATELLKQTGNYVQVNGRSANAAG